MTSCQPQSRNKWPFGPWVMWRLCSSEWQFAHKTCRFDRLLLLLSLSRWWTPKMAGIFLYPHFSHLSILPRRSKSPRTVVWQVGFHSPSFPLLRHALEHHLCVERGMTGKNLRQCSHFFRSVAALLNWPFHRQDGLQYFHGRDPRHILKNPLPQKMQVNFVLMAFLFPAWKHFLEQNLAVFSRFQLTLNCLRQLAQFKLTAPYLRPSLPVFG